MIELNKTTVPISLNLIHNRFWNTWTWELCNTDFHIKSNKIFHSSIEAECAGMTIAKTLLNIEVLLKRESVIDLKEYDKKQQELNARYAKYLKWVEDNLPEDERNKQQLKNLERELHAILNDRTKMLSTERWHKRRLKFIKRTISELKTKV